MGSHFAQNPTLLVNLPLPAKCEVIDEEVKVDLAPISVDQSNGGSGETLTPQ